jgi:membrane-bound serine protease (ClpP class)
MPWLVLASIVMSSFSHSALAIQDEKKGTVPDATKPRPEMVTKPAVIEFKGPIDQKLTAYFNNRFQAARRAGVDLLIIEIDSPGGLKIESLQMARQLRDCKWAYTIALISNEAISGGALVSLGCDEILIEPNGKFGDAGEIGFDPEQWAWRLIEPKIESYLSRDARDLAESKGRSPDLAEAMVDKDVLVYIRPNPDIENGKPQFKSVRSDSKEPIDPTWDLVQETGRERFLTLSGQRAVELGMAQGSESSLDEVADSFDFDVSKIRVYRPTTTDSLVYYLNLPWITVLLVLVGLVALYFELSAPGIGAGGLISGFCVVLFFWSRFLGGTSGWLEVILFAAGLVFLFTEIFVIPGFGIPGIAGIILLFASVILASQTFVLPQNATEWNQTLTSMLIILCAGAGFLVSAVFISKRMGTIPVLNRMVLAPPPESPQPTTTKDGKPIPPSHPPISVGDWGRADSFLRPAGRAKFAGRSFDVVSDGAYVEPGTQVRVIRIFGNIITVAEVEEEADDLGNTHHKKSE